MKVTHNEWPVVRNKNRKLKRSKPISKPLIRLVKYALVAIVAIAIYQPAAPYINNQAKAGDVDEAVSHTDVKEPQTVQALSPQPQTQPETERPPEPPKEQPVAQVVVSHPIGCENYRNLVSQYNWNVDVALNVMRAESGCNPNAVGDGHLTYWQDGTKYGMSCGMFQVRFLPGRPSCSEMQVPEKNIAYAYALYKANGWRPWSVCANGKVNCI